MKVLGLSLLIALIFAGVAFNKFIHLVVPHSAQVYIAAVAGCEFLSEELRDPRPDFRGAKLWEKIAGRVFRYEQWYLSDNFVFSDSLASNDSVFHALFTAGDAMAPFCHTEISKLALRYAERGAPIDHYDDHGYTPLQYSVITRNTELVDLFLSLGADPNLVVKSPESKVMNLNVYEIIELFLSKKPDDQALEEIKNMVVANGPRAEAGDTSR